MKGKFQIKFNGQPAVKSPASDELFFFDYQTKSDQNRAMHGCEVLFKPKPFAGQGKRMAQIIKVIRYPGSTKHTGLLRINRGQLVFKPLDRRFGELIVHEIDPEVWQLIKDDSEIGGYSVIARSKVSEEFVQRHFFKAEFTTWTAYEHMPYCKLTVHIGSILDETVYKKTLLENQGISEEAYPFRAMEQAKEIEATFDEQVLPKEKAERSDLSDELVFTIDGAQTQAFDDAISF